MRFIIIDDDLGFAANLQMRLLQEFTGGVTVDISETFSHSMLKYDVYFLDIDMPTLDGISIATRIRDDDKQAIIIFVSYREDLVFASLEVLPLQFMRKNTLETDLKMVIRNLKMVLEENIYAVEFPIVGSVPKTILLKNVRYIEKCGTNIIVHMVHGEFRVRSTISHYTDVLPESMFGLLGQSHLINYRYVASIEGNHIVMMTGEILYFSRGKKKAFKEKYIQYLRGHKS